MAGSYNLRSGSTNRGGWAIDELTPGATRPALKLSIPANAVEGALGGLGLGGF
jgi:hypothetical protein